MTSTIPAPSRRRTRVRVAALSALLALGSLGGLHAATAAAPTAGTTAGDLTTSSALTPTARAAGLTPAGGASMGWSHRGVRGTQPLASPGTTPAAAIPGTTAGIDVSHYQGTVNWGAYYVYVNTRFAYIQATEGTSYKDPQFGTNYNASYNWKIIRGAYHFARPDVSSGATQASYFASNGGGWSRDGRTLPGALDIRYNPYGATCYGKTAASMVSWIRNFVTTYHSRTGRYPVIYSIYDWWSTCTGNSSAFSSTSPFWMARYGSTVGSVPAGASTWTFWQFTSTPIDLDRFYGDTARLTALANG